MAIRYEWTVETVTDDEYEDITDNYFSDNYKEAAETAALIIAQGNKVYVGLVRDVLADDNEHTEDRQWAYLEGGRLPAKFSTAGGSDGAKVPQKFHKEVEKRCQWCPHLPADHLGPHRKPGVPEKASWRR